MKLVDPTRIEDFVVGKLYKFVSMRSSATMEHATNLTWSTLGSGDIFMIVERAANKLFLPCHTFFYILVKEELYTIGFNSNPKFDWHAECLT
jgi:hypothetical protein